MLRGGIPRPIGNYPENVSQAILVGIILVGRLAVSKLCRKRAAGRQRGRDPEDRSGVDTEVPRPCRYRRDQTETDPEDMDRCKISSDKRAGKAP